MKTFMNHFTGAMLFVMIGLTGCNFDIGERGNGELVDDIRNTGSFQELELQGNFEVILQKSNDANVVIHTDENLIGLIEVENSGGRLIISTTRRLRPSRSSKIIVNYETLDHIQVSGAASLHSENVVEGRSLQLVMSGAGEVDLDVDLGRLQINVSGAGAVKLRGSVEEQYIEMSGAGGYDAEDLESRRCKISISGVGGAKVNVTEDLQAQVSGVGGVTYSGNPVSVKSDVSGIGSISASDKDPS